MRRIILSLNNNPTYTGFWPIVSKVWRKFGFEPTLAFLGSEKERRELRLDEHGEVVILDPSFGVKRADRDWRVTWGLFYAASLFPEDTCMTHGIDQIPLSRYFEALFGYEGKYVVGLSDGYKSEKIFPSSHHVGLGGMFKSALGIEDKWEDEVLKTEKYAIDNLPSFQPPFFNARTFWGLDEIRTSDLLRENPVAELIKGFSHEILFKNRLDRGGRLEYNDERLARGDYSEIHCPRPVHAHLDYINNLISKIPC